MVKTILEALLPEIAETFRDETKARYIINRISKNYNIIQNSLLK